MIPDQDEQQDFSLILVYDPEAQTRAEFVGAASQFLESKAGGKCAGQQEFG